LEIIGSLCLSFCRVLLQKDGAVILSSLGENWRWFGGEKKEWSNGLGTVFDGESWRTSLVFW